MMNTDFNPEEGKYHPDQLPNEVEITVYTHYCISGWRAGEIVNFDFNAKGEEYVLLTKTPLKIKIPMPDDFKKQVVESLQAEQEKIKAESFKKVKDLQDKIDSLLCLEYQPQE